MAVALGCSGVACSLLISGEPEPLSCSQEGQAGPPACDPGFSCQDGHCRAFLPPAAGGTTSGEADGGAGAGGAGSTHSGGGAAGAA
jgi:hypothetical protein